MLKLLRKDLILNWRVLALTYVFWSLLWLGGPAMSSSGELPFGMWSGMVSVACAFLPLIAFGREDKFKAGALACSLPVTRGAIVASRYIGGWLVSLTAVAVAVGAMVALSLVGIRPLLPPTPMLPVVVVVVVGVALALMMPLPIRFGITGVIGFAVFLQLLGVVVMLASALFDIRAVQLIESAIRSAIDGSRRLYARLGPVSYSAALVAAVAALNVASCRLSISIFRRREF
jgi:ABC-type transport system involved in multi-copper enzyme maturation permease subunit